VGGRTTVTLDELYRFLREGAPVPPSTAMGSRGGSFHGHGSGFAAPLGPAHPAAHALEVATAG